MPCREDQVTQWWSSAAIALTEKRFAQYLPLYLNLWKSHQCIVCSHSKGAEKKRTFYKHCFAIILLTLGQQNAFLLSLPWLLYTCDRVPLIIFAIALLQFIVVSILVLSGIIPFTTVVASSSSYTYIIQRSCWAIKISDLQRGHNSAHICRLHPRVAHYPARGCNEAKGHNKQPPRSMYECSSTHYVPPTRPTQCLLLRLKARYGQVPRSDWKTIQ